MSFGTRGSFYLALFLVLLGAMSAFAQTVPPVRGAYTPGFNATNSGVLPEPGFSYQNTFMSYNFQQLKGPDGGVVGYGDLSVLADANVFVYVAKKKVLGGNIGVAALIPFSNSSLSSADIGAVAGGGGIGDTFFQPFTIGWHLKRADIQAAYSFFAPTGKFNPGGSSNNGTGYWTNAPNAGETIYLTKNKATAISAYQMYEIHGTQKGTNLHAGQTFDVDYSLSQMLPLLKDEKALLQLAFVGYSQWQLTNATGPGVDPVYAHSTHYAVHAAGVGANVLLPPRKISLGFKYFKEYSNTSTVQGNSLQIQGAISF